MRRGLANTMLHEVERRQAGRYVERHGMVTSYDPDKYLAKVTFQPDGQESGWLPIETGHVGNGFGIAIGLTPGSGGGTTSSGGGGSGGSNSTNSGGQQQPQGDQVIVRYQEGDIESGKIVQRVHSDEDKPPKVKSGEMVFWHKNGAMIFFSNDGSLSFRGGKAQQGDSQGQQSGDPNQAPDESVAFYKLDGQGNITMQGQAKTDTLQKDHNVTIKGDKNVTINGKRNDMISKVWGAVAQFGNWNWLVSGSDSSD